jgi:hypothetical protein
MTMTGQLWSRQDTKESSHEQFQALWRHLHKYTDENHANIQQNRHSFRTKFAPGPSLTRLFFFEIICRPAVLLGKFVIEMCVV